MDTIVAIGAVLLIVLVIVIVILFGCYHGCCRKASLHIKSWNIDHLTGNQPQKRKEILDRLNRSAILALQETHLQSHMNFEIDEGEIFMWRYDREPMKCNRDGGGLMVFFRNDLVMLRLAGMRQLPDVTMKRKDPSTIKAGLQYMHFKLTRPIEIDLVVIYHSSGEDQHVIDLVRFFRNVLQIHNILFVGDFNVNPKRLSPLRDKYGLTLHINGMTSYKDPKKPSQTDHIISDFMLCDVNAGIENWVKKEISDHCVIWCEIPIEIPLTDHSIPVFQPVWDVNETAKNINECRWRLLVFYSTFSKYPNSKTIQSDVMQVYTSNSEAELIYIQENNHPIRLDEYREKVVHLRRCRPCLISLRCTVICSELPDQNFKKIVQSFTSGNLSNDFERFASRYYMCDEPNEQDGCFTTIFRTEADKMSHAIQRHGLKPFKCETSKGKENENEICGQEFDREQLYWEHKARICKPKDYKKCTFANCNEYLYSRFTERHMLLAHGKFLCDESCGGFLYKHERSCHECRPCTDKFPTQKTLTQHMRKKHQQRLTWMTKCPGCDKVYQKNGFFERHVNSCLSVKDPRFRCKRCNGCFETEDWWKKHEKCCQSTRQFVCANCRKAFENKDRLSNHVEHCGSIQPYKCKRCGNEYVTEGWYNKHVKECKKKKKNKNC